MELAFFQGTFTSNFQTIRSFFRLCLRLKEDFLQFLHKETILYTKFDLKMVSSLVFKFAQVLSRFVFLFHNTGDLYGVSLFLGYLIFKFLENKGIRLALFTFRGSFLAVLVKRTNSLDTVWFENSFLSCVQLCRILKQFSLHLPQYRRFIWS